MSKQIDAHVPAFQFAQAHHIPCTAHAGEACGAESVWETLQHFQPRRIGYGVRSVEDATLLEHLHRHNIHLEVCPTSNVQANVCHTYADHPLNHIYKADVSMSVNSDGRTLSGITLADEYEKAHRIFGWDKEHFLKCNLNALGTAFISDEIKESLIHRLIEAYQHD